MSQVKLHQRIQPVEVDRYPTVEVDRYPTRPVSKGSSKSAKFRCLIASDDASRVSMFSRAAVEQGWEPVVCYDAKMAAREAICQQFQMAVVDVAENGDSGAVSKELFREIAERLVAEKNALIMICGSEDDADEEIWARQIGAWIYLPGVDEQTDIAMLCGESKNIVEKLRGLSPDYESSAIPNGKTVRPQPR